ncbi:class I SAM-dependent methyltransferase [Gilvimarinus polysaccharolyticus]|uniref:class I SAM-dependent methyltransferase n=1 Tax=Gilvimarinus polysaccharolyticus TaxID=863921 RepID=UPI00067349E3|nr:class I SAM-dependent methyltransferase [Gilvimarinus polysaccharolyticus]
MVQTVVIVNDSSDNPARRAAAATAARALGCELLLQIDPADLQEPPFALLFAADGVSLQQTGRKAPGPVRVDFLTGAVNHRRLFGGGKGQMIAKAVGVGARVKPRVLDATAGLGRDAFVLATLGCQVTMLERSPLVWALLNDGLQRAYAGADSELIEIVNRLSLQPADARDYLLAPPEQLAPDVIYLDPMFPSRGKSADVKKEMQAFHQVVGADLDAAELLAKARALATYRVVVKRPRKAPDLADTTPSYRLEGKSSRYDIYTRQKLPAELNP